jgi:hypothetical protein
MGERKRESSAESVDEMFEPVLGDFSEEVYEGIVEISSDKLALAEKRRRLEQRLEERRLREELGDYDLEFDY